MDQAIVKFCTERLDEDEWWAREASRHDDNPVPDGGHHWQWVDVESDQAITPDPVASHYVELSEGGFRVSLRSVEQYPCNIPGTLPQFAISSAEEVPVAVGGHIARHDPARVLREVAAKRRLLQEIWTGMEDFAVNIEESRDGDDSGAREYRDQLLGILALAYSDHPDYQEAWRV